MPWMIVWPAYAKKAIGEALKKGNAPGVKQMVEAAVAEGCPIADIMNEALVTAMSEIGILFKNNEIYVPEVLIAARAMQAGMGSRPCPITRAVPTTSSPIAA